MQTRWPTVKRERCPSVVVDFVLLFLACWGLTIALASISNLAFIDPVGAFQLCAVCTAILLVSIFVYLRRYVYTREEDRLRAEVTTIAIAVAFFGAGMVTIHLSLPQKQEQRKVTACTFLETPDMQCVHTSAYECTCNGRVVPLRGFRDPDGPTGRAAHLDGPGQCTPSGPDGDTGPQGHTLAQGFNNNPRQNEKVDETRYDDVILKATDKIVVVASVDDDEL